MGAGNLLLSCCIDSNWSPSAHGETSGAIRHTRARGLLLCYNRVLTIHCIVNRWGSHVYSSIILMMIMMTPSTPFSTAPITGLFLPALFFQGLLLHLFNDTAYSNYQLLNLKS